jgi:Zn-dependent protease
MLKYSIFINFILAVFNLIPLPPLDGSKMVSSFLKGEALRKFEALAAYTPFIFLGIMVLSIMGVSTLGYLLAPAQQLGQNITLFFLRMFGAF